MVLSALPTLVSSNLRVAEFFAGIGLARLGLEEAGFTVRWANDIEPFKQAMYEGNFGRAPFGHHQFQLGDVAMVNGADLPDIEVGWASFPCTDLSLAGARAGISGAASSTFFHFTRVLGEMGKRAPQVVAVENVHGLATSHGGEDMAAAVRALNELGYSVDVLSIDARRFVPQSRPRLFIIGALNPPDSSEETSELRPDFLQGIFADTTLVTHRAKLPELPAPLLSGFGSVVEQIDASDSRWWDSDRQARFVASLSEVQSSRFEALRTAGQISYRTAYRRTRGGIAVWEIRPDDISGCLRTARGGSSKQAVVKLGNGVVQVRWMTPREYARLMGASDYALEGHTENRVLFGFGDAVCAPVVSWVAEKYLAPLLKGDLGVAHDDRLKVVNG